MFCNNICINLDQFNYHIKPIWHKSIAQIVTEKIDYLIPIPILKNGFSIFLFAICFVSFSLFANTKIKTLFFILSTPIYLILKGLYKISLNIYSLPSRGLGETLDGRGHSQDSWKIVLSGFFRFPSRKPKKPKKPTFQES